MISKLISIPYKFFFCVYILFVVNNSYSQKLSYNEIVLGKHFAGAFDSDVTFHLYEYEQDSFKYFKKIIDEKKHTNILFINDILLQVLMKKDYGEETKSKSILLFGKGLVNHLYNEEFDISLSLEAEGIMYFAEEKYKKAIYYLSKAFNKNNESRTLLMKAYSKLFLKDFYGAIADCDLSFKLNNEKKFNNNDKFNFIFAKSIALLANIELKKYSKAIIISNEILKIDENNSDVIYKKAYSEVKSGKIEEGCINFSKAAEINTSYYDHIFDECK